MSFHIIQHNIPCQHIHQYHTSHTADQQLAVKQYIPVSNPSPSVGDITIIATHGNGLVKELYEPLWEDLEKDLRTRGRRIRSIWIADVSSQGASGLLNEDSKYDDVSWYDHSRDLLHMVNVFRSAMIHPIVGIGHSMGANVTTMLSLIHPHLFTTLILLEPVISHPTIMASGSLLSRQTLRRRVSWPSRSAAESHARKALPTWDSRVLERWDEFALYPPRRLEPTSNATPEPTAKNEEKEVKLTTGRYQELTRIIRPSYIYTGSTTPPSIENMTWTEEILAVHHLLEYIPCNTLFLTGSLSPTAPKPIREEWVKRTGKGKMPSHMGRKMRERRVEEKVLEGAGHWAPMERPAVCASLIAGWLDEEVKGWEGEEKMLGETWDGLGKEEKEARAVEWMEKLKAKI